MRIRLFRQCAQRGRSLARALRQRLLAATKPAEQAVVTGTLTDLVRSPPALVAENAFPRQQLAIRRRVKRPRRTPGDRVLLGLRASRIRAWRQARLRGQPETLRRWHRQGFRLCGPRKARPRSAPQPQVAAETIALIRELAAANRLWGAERSRGELLKGGLRVAKTTVQRHMRDARPAAPARPGQAPSCRSLSDSSGSSTPSA
jgi:putative transposase